MIWKKELRVHGSNSLEHSLIYEILAQNCLEENSSLDTKLSHMKMSEELDEYEEDAK